MTNRNIQDILGILQDIIELLLQILHLYLLMYREVYSLEIVCRSLGKEKNIYLRNNFLSLVCWHKHIYSKIELLRNETYAKQSLTEC